MLGSYYIQTVGMMMKMNSITSSAVVLSRELSSSRCHPCIRTNNYNIPGSSQVITIPNRRLLWFKNTSNRSSSFTSLAISSDQVVSATESDPELTWQILVGALGIFCLPYPHKFSLICSYII